MNTPTPASAPAAIPTPKSVKHSVSAIFVTIVVLVLLWGTGVLLRPVDLVGQLTYVRNLVMMIGFFAVLGGFLLFAVVTGIMHKSLSSFFAGLRRTSHVSGFENLSRAFLLIGILGLAAQLVGWPSTTGLNAYFYELLTKGSIALLVVLAFLSAWSFLLGLNTVDHFVAYFDEPKNNQIVFAVMGMANLLMFLAMHIK